MLIFQERISAVAHSPLERTCFKMGWLIRAYALAMQDAKGAGAARMSASSYAGEQPGGA